MPRTLLLVLTLFTLAACHHAPPPARPAPAVTPPPQAAPAPEGKAEADEEQTADLCRRDEQGRWGRLDGATVRLRCLRDGDDRQEQGGTRVSCSSALVVTAQRGGRAVEVARNEKDVAGLDYEKVAGNRGRLGLDLLELPGCGALIVVRSETAQGDEGMTETTHEDLYLLHGSALDLVLGYDARVREDQSFGDAGYIDTTESTLAPGDPRPGGLPDLVLTSVRTHRTEDAPEDRSERTRTFAWTGARYTQTR